VLECTHVDTIRGRDGDRRVTLADDVRLYARFLGGLRGYLSERWTVETARADVERALEQRERSFLRVVERSVYDSPQSPYRALLAHAGCTFHDLRTLVSSRGLEAALVALREAGVYVRFEEFKGYEAIVRGSLRLPVAAADFDNPFLARAYSGATGGSTGAGTRVWLDLDHLAASSARVLLGYSAHRLDGLPQALWRAPLPSAAGINYTLRLSRMGAPPERWFTHVRARELGGPLYRASTPTILALARLFGTRLARPEYVPLDRPAPIVRWARAAVERAGGAVIGTTISQAVRVADAAREAGEDLRGVTFWASGEPITPAKVAAVQRSGARHVPSYHFVESGAVGLGCARPVDENDLHLLSDQLALVVFEREVSGAGRVPAFHFTSLTATAPKILLNTESDDYGVVETRDCGCPLGQLGYRTHVRGVASFRKLTGEGVTLVGSEMERILEQVLPERFGGGPLDYQLLEEEDPASARTLLFIVVDPRLGPLDEAQVVETVLAGLEHRPGGSAVARSVWREAGSLRVRRAAPEWTSRGKLLPLRSHASGRAPRD
jgi:hypothetical protein